MDNKIRFDLDEEHPEFAQNIQVWYTGGYVLGDSKNGPSDKVTWNALITLPDDIVLAFSGDLPYKGMPEIGDADEYVRKTVLATIENSLKLAFDDSEARNSDL